MYMQAETQIIRFPALSKKLGDVSRSTVDRWEKSKSFPKRIHLGQNSIGWNLLGVEQWLAERSRNAEQRGN